MLKRWLALAWFIGSSLWIYFWEWIRSQLYERAQHMLAPYFEWLTLDELGRYGPPFLFIALGSYLFWLTRPRPATTAQRTDAGNLLLTTKQKNDLDFLLHTLSFSLDWV